MIMHLGDEVRAAERITRLIGRYAERFDPPSRAEFYGNVAGRLQRMHAAEELFVRGEMICRSGSPRRLRVSSGQENRPEG